MATRQVYPHPATKGEAMTTTEVGTEGLLTGEEGTITIEVTEEGTRAGEEADPLLLLAETMTTREGIETEILVLREGLPLLTVNEPARHLAPGHRLRRQEDAPRPRQVVAIDNVLPLLPLAVKTAEIENVARAWSRQMMPPT